MTVTVLDRVAFGILLLVLCAGLAYVGVRRLLWKAATYGPTMLMAWMCGPRAYDRWWLGRLAVRDRILDQYDRVVAAHFRAVYRWRGWPVRAGDEGEGADGGS